ncbi:hypothetical protein [Sporosarcina sp. FSL K6-2383]|uniref:hypothetical protein n=1 Tax=Sporosarcina sp. FSL K6-2383 TaxID=2921556 RepID=UPI00315AA500
MDIVVTIPKSEYENDDNELVDYLSSDDVVMFWTLPVIPKQLQVGDRVYFVKNNRIERSMRLLEIKMDSQMTCETTGRQWSGKCQLIMNDLRMEQFNTEIKGFQGFRYLKTVMG